MKMDEKLEKEREERRKLFLSWDIENDLPCEVGDYILKRIDFPTMEDRKTSHDRVYICRFRPSDLRK